MDAGAPPADTYQTQRKAGREVEKKASVEAEEKAEIEAKEDVWKEDVHRSQFDEDAGENAVEETSVGATLVKRSLLAGSCPGVL